jgi:hypothetical protein
MTVYPLPLPPGEHELDGPVQDSRIGSLDRERALAKLVLTVGTPRTEVLLARRGATTLAIELGEKAAMKLSRDLDRVSRTMGWQTPKEGGSPT